VHVGEGRRLLERGSERQASGGDVPREDVIESGFVERHGARPEDLDLGGVDVEADDLEAEVGHARRVRGTQVARSDNGQS
jgi:hypothetical protein